MKTVGRRNIPETERVRLVAAFRALLRPRQGRATNGSLTLTALADELKMSPPQLSRILLGRAIGPSVAYRLRGELARIQAKCALESPDHNNATDSAK